MVYHKSLLNCILLNLFSTAGFSFNNIKGNNEQWFQKLKPTYYIEQQSMCQITSHTVIKDERQIRSTAKDSMDYRLPDYIIPKEYFLHITPFIALNNLTFDGMVKIVAYVEKTTSDIILHADLMKIKKVVVLRINYKNVSTIEAEITEVVRIEKYQFLQIVMKSPIDANTQIQIDILYKGMLNTDMNGFYISSYKMNNETRWLAATHLQPTDARKVFPCFDEPALKAVFHVTVTTPQDYIAISNMPVKGIIKENTFEFESTPLMSTYLLAIVLSDFESLSMKDEERFYRVWTGSELISKLPYALSVIPKSINALENRLGIPYPLPKLDMAAIPDFSQGAMENWGLLIYREVNILYDSDSTPLKFQRNIRNTITHELAHQWFGNLVTPKWWDCLWLSEAFATYSEMHVYEISLSSWDLESEFVVNFLQLSFSIDALPNTLPVFRKINNPNEISLIFDAIIYNKGASLVRMLEKLLGSQIFFGALHRYLQANTFSIGTPELLYAAFEEEIKFHNYQLNTTISTLMDSWILQPGFPVVHASFKKNFVSLKQERFFLYPPKFINKKVMWIVPINWATQSNANFHNTRTVIWLRDPINITITNSASDWVILNIQQTGYYRVNYDHTMWQRIITVLKSKGYATIHKINRASLIDDLFNLGRVGLVDYNVVLSATEYLIQESNYIPWKAASTGLTYLKMRFDGHSEIYTYFKEYVISLLKPSCNRLGFQEINGEEHFDALFRELVLKWLCDLEYKECITYSLNAFQASRKVGSNYKISVNHLYMVYCVVIKHGSTQHWDDLWEQFTKSNFATEKITILSALACSQNITNLKRLLAYTITPHFGIKKQDFKQIFIFVITSSEIGLETTLKFMISNYQHIQNYVANKNEILSIFRTISRYLSTESLLHKFQHVIDNEGNILSADILKYLQVFLQKATYEFDWYKKYSPKILNWFKFNYPFYNN